MLQSDHRRATVLPTAVIQFVKHFPALGLIGFSPQLRGGRTQAQPYCPSQRQVLGPSQMLPQHTHPGHPHVMRGGRHSCYPCSLEVAEPEPEPGSAAQRHARSLHRCSSSRRVGRGAPVVTSLKNRMGDRGCMGILRTEQRLSDTGTLQGSRSRLDPRQNTVTLRGTEERAAWGRRSVRCPGVCRQRLTGHWAQGDGHSRTAGGWTNVALVLTL